MWLDMRTVGVNTERLDEGGSTMASPQTGKDVTSEIKVYCIVEIPNSPRCLAHTCRASVASPPAAI